VATETRDETAEAQIRRLLDDHAEALRTKDITGSLAHYAPGVLSFDVVDPLRYHGIDAVRLRLETWVSSFRGPIEYEMRDLRITTGDEVAFCHSLNHVSATTMDGTPLDMWWRVTVGLRRIDGKWLVTHEHASVPFDVVTGQASLGLQP
jgi:ketosteroid isomerase-like protein